MPSSFSPLLRTELPALGEQAGTWGTTNNTNIGTLLEAAISGTVSHNTAGAADTTLTALNGAVDEARNAVIKLTGAVTASHNVICPTSSKMYLVSNATTGAFVITFKTVAGTGVPIPQGGYAVVYCDGTNIVNVDVSGLTHLATTKATPVDADELPLVDSAGSNGLKKLTWANLKAAMSAYRDTLKDTTGGYPGMTLFKINFRNAANTFTSFFTNANTAARTYTFQDRDGTVADNTDLALKAPLISPAFTTPNLGTPSAGVLTNCTGTAAGLTAGSATQVTGSAAVTGAVSSSSASAGVGYATGAGGVVSQSTNIGTVVTLNAVSGGIVAFTTNFVAGNTYAVPFVNSTIAVTDMVIINHNCGPNLSMSAYVPGAGGATISIYCNITATLSPVIRFGVFKTVIN